MVTLLLSMVSCAVRLESRIARLFSLTNPSLPGEGGGDISQPYCSSRHDQQPGLAPSLAAASSDGGERQGREAVVQE